eukprot:5921397-Pyramimonas_sp.AAC.1
MESHGQDASCSTGYSFSVSERPRAFGREDRGLRPGGSRGQAETHERKMGSPMGQRAQRSIPLPGASWVPARPQRVRAA